MFKLSEYQCENCKLGKHQNSLVDILNCNEYRFMKICNDCIKNGSFKVYE